MAQTPVPFDETSNSVKIKGGGEDIAEVLSAAPPSDTGQAALAVRVVSSLAAGGGGGGGAVTVADGADAAQGSTADADSANTVIGLLKKVKSLLSSPLTTNATIQNASVPVTGTFWQTTQPVSGPLTDAQLRASAVPVRSAIDTAVQQVLLSWDEMAGTANTESALTNATFRSENLVALGAATSYTVPAGKRLRVTNVNCYVKATSTVNNLARFRIRAVASGNVLNSSPPIFNVVQSIDAPGTVAANLTSQRAYTIPEGSLDLPAGAQLAFTWLTAANTCTVGMSVVGYLYTP